MEWRALYTEPRSELKARDALVERGFEVFCPFERVTERRKAPRRLEWRAVESARPLFDRYLFARTDELLAVRRVPGIICVVACAGVPLRVPAAVVERIRSVAVLSGPDAGLVSRRDATLASLAFRGRVGEVFSFRRGHAFEGLVGLLTSLDYLDTSGEVECYVKMLGGDRRFVVPASAVGEIVGCGGPRITASAA